ncbi:MAG TPA: hypothetical protein VFG21_09835, partial [Xanthomonadaceae bacterium]|nr:hypothetical protein [Xanthomonadaceae bacterium]
RDDHAVFPQSRLSSMQAAGYTDQLTMLGYAYPNIDSDGDTLVDGLEYVIGTNPNNTNSDCYQGNDAAEYPPYEDPVSDPMFPVYCP